MEDFIINQCAFGPLTQNVIDRSFPFICNGDIDMDDFFRTDAIKYHQFKMGNSYCFLELEDPRNIVACFTVSNDSLRIYDLPNSRKNAMWNITKREKMLSRFPGVLIGRLAVSKDFEKRGIGSQVLDFLKYWFSDAAEKSACRFLIVDAKNEPEVLAFYEKNNFEYLFTTELQEDIYSKPPKTLSEEAECKQKPRKLRTRLMYFDLLTLK